jgi:predicted kinase
MAPGAVILRSDAIRKEFAGVDPSTPLSPDQYGVAATARVYAALKGGR